MVKIYTSEYINNHWPLDFNKSDIMVAYPYMEDKVTNIHDIKEVMDN